MLLNTYKNILVLKILSLFLGGVLLILYMFLISASGYTKIQEHTFIVDLSHSMNIKDIDTPDGVISRLDHVKKMIEDTLPTNALISVIGCDDRVCAYILPPSTDHGFIRQRLAHIHTNTLVNKHKDMTPLPHLDTISFLSDGSSGGTFPGSLDAILSQAHDLHIYTIGNSKAYVVVDPTGEIIYQDGIRKTHTRNDKQLLQYTSSLHTHTDHIDTMGMNNNQANLHEERALLLYLASFLIVLGL